MPAILIIEDDTAIHSLIKEALGRMVFKRKAPIPERKGSCCSSTIRLIWFFWI